MCLLSQLGVSILQCFIDKEVITYGKTVIKDHGGRCSMEVFQLIVSWQEVLSLFKWVSPSIGEHYNSLQREFIILAWKR